MFDPPSDITDDQVAVTFANGWNQHVDSIRYLPVGFGNHHWIVDGDTKRWFLTLYPAGTTTRLGAARRLWLDGADFVVAAEPSHNGQLTEVLESGELLAAFAWVDGRFGAWGPYQSRSDQLAVIEMLGQLHTHTVVLNPPPTDDFQIPSRSELDVALANLDQAWDAGPHSARTRELLATNRDHVARAFECYDAMVLSIDAANPWVFTHGEPHPGNVVFTDEGSRLVDWDTALLAPRERDLWLLIKEDPDLAHIYHEQTGRRLDPAALALYELRWHLSDVALFVDDFRRPHEDTTDRETAWHGLVEHLLPLAE